MPLYESEKQFFNWLRNHSKSSNLTLSEIRESIGKLNQFIDKPADIPYQDLTLSCKDGHHLKLRYYQVSDQVRPLIIFLPGNGFVYDLFEANHSVISKISAYSDCHAIMINYKLAPEYPYPIALEDAEEAIYFIFKNLNTFNVDNTKIILAGFSSGANLAAVITNKFRFHPTISLFHQFLISGAYDYTNSLHQFDEYAIQDRLLSPEEAKFSFDAYCKDEQRKDPSCSPYWEDDLSNLPPTTIMVAEYDGGRSQSEGYYKKLIAAGNKVTKVVLTGQTHGTILYRKALSDGKDPALVAGTLIKKIVTGDD